MSPATLRAIRASVRRSRLLLKSPVAKKRR
jgi:hypothetical protein